MLIRNSIKITFSKFLLLLIVLLITIINRLASAQPNVHPIILKSITLPYKTMPLSTVYIHNEVWITAYGRQSILIFDCRTGILIKELKDPFLAVYMASDEQSGKVFLSSFINKGIEVIDELTFKEQIIVTNDNFNRLTISDRVLYACAFSSPKLY